MTDMDLLLWARGPGLQIGMAIGALGVLLRLVEIFGLGRPKDLSTPRASGTAQGWKTIFSRSVPSGMVARNTAFTVIAGYIFHIGFIAVLLFFAAHVEFFKQQFGIPLPALPTAPLDALSLLSIAALVALLVHRINHPVKRLLSRPDDYVAWVLTLLPMLTGYLAFHHQLLPYTLMLAVHILTVALFLALFPFTKLVHIVTVFVSRYYNGAILGRKGGGV